VLVSAAVCPHPPLLVPEVAGGAADDVADLREACREAVRRLLATRPDRVVVIGSAPSPGEWDGTAGGSLAGYGVLVTVGGTTVELPLSLTIGAWLLDVDPGQDREQRPETEAGPGMDPGPEAESGTDAQPPARTYVAVADDAAPHACARLGARLATEVERVALLVMGDGSAKRSRTAPGYLDPRAAGFDAAVAAALREPDPEALLALDPQTAQDLWVAGRPAWQVLAGAAQATYRVEPDRTIHAELTYDDDPFGVGYLVAHWWVEDAPSD
jgi:hypothetical protein